MGRIFYILGKSASGKDTIYNRLLEDMGEDLKRIVLYTTRPRRQGEEEGKSYHFVTEEEFKSLKASGLIIEDRAYDTVHGIWRYFTVKDSDIDIKRYNYIITGVLQSFVSTRRYFGEDRVIPVYVEVEDGERLRRALIRELRPENRKFKEMCRRFLSDDEDFCEEKLKEAGIRQEDRFENDDLERCLGEIKKRLETFRLQDAHDSHLL